MPMKINGESFTVADSDRQRTAREVAFDVAGRDSGEVRITDLGEIDPAGRYRWRSEGDKLLLQRANAATPDGEYLWPSALTLVEVGKDEVGFKVPLNLDRVLPFVAHVIASVPLEALDVTWLGEGYGPTEGPAGYLMVSIDDNDEGVGYLPFWRNPS